MNYEQIENYLQNGLTEAERTAFEAAMATDPVLAEAVSLYRDIETKMQGTIKASAGEAALKQQLDALNQQYFGKKGGATVMQMQPEAHSGLGMGKAAAVAVEAPVVAMRRRRMLYYFASAAAVVLVFLLIRPFGGGSTASLDDLYTQNDNYSVPDFWAPSPARNSPGDETDPSKKTDSLAIMKFQVAGFLNDKKDPNYAEALRLLEKITERDSNDETAILAKGACYTQTDDSARAMQLFLSVEAKPNGKLKTQAIWYKALLYLKYKDITACRATLANIPAESDFGDEAKTLLKALPKQ